MHRLFLTALLTAVFYAPCFAFALEPAPPAASTQAPTSGRTAVVHDEATGTVHIQIDGKDVVVIDATGLHVVGDITYDGLIQDSATGAPDDR